LTEDKFLDKYTNHEYMDYFTKEQIDLIRKMNAFYEEKNKRTT